MVAVTHFMRAMKSRDDIKTNWAKRVDWDVEFVGLAKIAHIERVLETHFVMSECFGVENLQSFLFKAFQNTFKLLRFTKYFLCRKQYGSGHFFHYIGL